MNMFIDADNGKIKIYKGVDNIVGGADTPEMIAYILETHKFWEHNVVFQSSMDFADENGFENSNDAKDLYDKALKILADNINYNFK